MTVSITHTTPSDDSFSTQGAAAWDAAHAVSGLGSLAEQNANNVAVTGGSINGTTVGSTTPAAGTFTTLTANSTSQFGKSSANYVQADGAATTLNPIISIAGSDTNVSMVLKPQGTGALDIAAGSKGVNISNGGTVTAITRTNGASTGYTSFPSITISAPTTTGGVQATASVFTMQFFGTAVPIQSGGTGYTNGDVLTLVGGTPQSAAGTLTVTAVSGGVVTAATWTAYNNYTALPTNPVSVTGGTGSGFTCNPTWSISSGGFNITNAGSGYVEQPTVSFSGGGGSGAAAYATVGSGTTVRTLGSTMSFVANNECLRITDVGGAGTAYWNFFNGGTTASMRATASSQAAIQSASAVPISFSTNASTSAAEQFRVSHTASAVNYVQVTGGASGTPATVTISGQGSSANIDLALTPKSTGIVKVTAGNGLGYGTGTGGAVTQATSRTTGVTLDKPNGAITLFSAAGTTTWQTFTVTNNTVAATDVVKVCQKSGADLYQIFVTNVAAGSFKISYATTGGTTTEQPVFNFAVIKAVVS